jgi:hypothetical protein
VHIWMHDHHCVAQVRSLADEVMAHLRTIAGTDAFLAAYSRARQDVMGLRRERKRQKNLQVGRQSAGCMKRRLACGGWLPSHLLYGCLVLIRTNNGMFSWCSLLRVDYSPFRKWKDF